MMLCIPLLPLDSGLIARVDSRDFWVLAIHEWHAQQNSSGHIYATRTEATANERGTGTVFMHRQIMGVSDDLWVDHVDGNGLNNCRSNLRICTPKQNAQNRRKNAHWNGQPTTSRYKGVSLGTREAARRWLASIRVNNHRYHLGAFADEVDAARAYDAAARRHFGEFARLNFPQEGERAA